MILSLVAVFVRLPYFTTAVIDWDESTFILMADRLLSGHLPQTSLSALKPPLAYVPYALFIHLFGPSIAAVRLGGLICVLIASVLIYLACKRRFGELGALMAGASVSIFATIDRGAGCTMLEHIALVPLSLAVLCWSSELPLARRNFLTGLCIGLAGSLRTNLLGVGLAPLLLTLIQFPHLGLKKTFQLLSVLALGAALPYFAPVPIYWLSGNLDLLCRSCLMAPAYYVSFNALNWQSRVRSLGWQVASLNVAGLALAWVVPMLALVTVFVLRRRLKQERAFLIALTAFLISGLLCVLATGMYQVRHHYVALVPYTAAISAFVYRLGFASKWRAPVAFVTLCLFWFALSPVFSQYVHAWRTVVEKTETDKVYQVCDYLRSQHVEGKYVYFTTAHIGYWLTGALLPTRFVHPSDVAKPHILSTIYRRPTDSASEIKSIFQKQPMFVVAPLHGPRIQCPNHSRQAADAIEDELRADYALEATFDDIAIFRRKRIVSSQAD